MRNIAVVQARMGSTRLPGKVLRRLGEHSVLAWTVRAALASGSLDEVVVATTQESADDAVEAECAGLGVPCYRGATEDVLSRFLGTLDRHPADSVLRITADCPLLDPAVISLVVAVMAVAKDLDYVSTAMPRTLPRGMDTEAVRTASLRGLDAKAHGHHRTHVTSYIYSHPQEYSLLGLTFPPDSSHLRVTLDTPEDWEVVKAIVCALGDGPHPVRCIVDWLEQNPEISVLNAQVRQKSLSEG